jgi:hypothetical protein
MITLRMVSNKLSTSSEIDPNDHKETIIKLIQMYFTFGLRKANSLMRPAIVLYSNWIAVVNTACQVEKQNEAYARLKFAATEKS